MNPLKSHQLVFNAETRGGWDAYTSHRRRISEILLPVAGNHKGRLCILGAGNCNDIDLPSLLETHREVCLVDWDDSSLEEAASRQGVAEHPQLHLIGGIDVTGMAGQVSDWSPRGVISDADLASCADNPTRTVLPSLLAPFDYVASTCLLSQLIGGIVHSVGERHPRFVELVQATRAGHLRLLMGLLGPGGVATLITDIVSSDTLPALLSAPDGSLDKLLAGLVSSRNHFHGLNPLVLAALAERDAVVSAALASQEILPNWRWDIGRRAYLVWAARYTKRAK